MNAMMTKSENRNNLDFNEILDFFFKSWIQAYRHLGWNVKTDKCNLFSFILLKINSYFYFEKYSCSDDYPI